MGWVRTDGGLAELAALSKWGNEKKAFSPLCCFPIIAVVALEWRRASVFLRAAVKGNQRTAAGFLQGRVWRCQERAACGLAEGEAELQHLRGDRE